MGVQGMPRWLLRLEGIAILLVSLHFYNEFGYSWVTFALLFLLPDLGMLGYLAGPLTGSYLYNITHTYVLPGLLAAVGYMIDQPSLYGVALIWTAHIAFDRMLGLGLKYPEGFRSTHLGPVGRVRELVDPD